MKRDNDLTKMHLGIGRNSLCRTIRSDAIKRYVTAAVSFHTLFGLHPRDCRNDNALDSKLSYTLSTVLDEQRRWEDVPNRSEHYTLERVDAMKHEFVASAPNTPTTAVLVAWFACGIFADFRLLIMGARCIQVRDHSL